MSTYFKYCGNDYATLAEADAASTEMKDNLDNKPTKWCMAVSVSGSADTGWVVSGVPLTDQEILNISGDGLYNYNAHHTGENFIGITADEVSRHVTEDRVEYVKRTGPNQIQEMEEIYFNEVAIQTFVGEPVAPTVEDMSVY
tara:strand:- start:1325 stop:1750 length:426 start_codon:yes stop_codon:yes gene_type:complete